MFMVDEHYQIKQPTSQYYAAKLLTEEWAQPVDSKHRLFRASSDVKDQAGHVLITAYPLERPDGEWSLMLINKDRDHPHSVGIAFSNSHENGSFAGPVTRITFGKAQYQWHPNRKQGYADPDQPPAVSSLNADRNTSYELPAASVTVLRGKLRLGKAAP
jgi:hypothetical protein